MTIFTNTTPIIRNSITTTTSTIANNGTHYQQSALHVAVILPAYFFFSYYGNLFLIVTLSRTKKKREAWKPVNVMILNIAIANVAITTIPALTNAMELVFESWVLGNFICYFSTFVQYYFQTVSNFCCAAIALQRYRAVANPLKEMVSKKRQTVYLVSAVWILSAAIAIVNAIVHRAGDKVGDIEVCFNTWINYPNNQGLGIVFIALSVCIYLVPMACITVLYAMLVFILRHRSLPGDLKEDAQIRRRTRENRQIAIMILITVMVFQLCWFPTVVVQILTSVQYGGRITGNVYRTETTVTALALFYCAITPWVFIGTVKSLKKRFQSQFKCFLFCKTQQHQQLHEKHMKGQKISISSDDVTTNMVRLTSL